MFERIFLQSNQQHIVERTRIIVKLARRLTAIDLKIVMLLEIDRAQEYFSLRCSAPRIFIGVVLETYPAEISARSNF